VTTYFVAGIVVGSVYAIATLGLVLTLHDVAHLNFAHGAVAFFVAVTFYQATVNWGWNAHVAGVLTIFRVLAAARAVSLGRAVSAPHRARHRPCASCRRSGSRSRCPRSRRFCTPTSTLSCSRACSGHRRTSTTIFGVHVDSNQVAVVVAAALIAVLLTVLMRATPYGLSVRAVGRFADDGRRERGETRAS